MRFTRLRKRKKYSDNDKDDEIIQKNIMFSQLLKTRDNDDELIHYLDEEVQIKGRYQY